MVFHVDYWDYLGWRDPFAAKAYTKRQRRYAAAGSVRSVYTPGFVVNGQEWRGWFRGQGLPRPSAGAGRLSVQIKPGHLEASFDGEGEAALHVAVLGFGLKTDIKRGENAGKKLREDFVVLSHASHLSRNGRWSVPLSKISGRKAERYAVAVWVSGRRNPVPLQATGGWIPKGIIPGPGH